MGCWGGGTANGIGATTGGVVEGGCGPCGVSWGVGVDEEGAGVRFQREATVSHDISLLSDECSAGEAVESGGDGAEGLGAGGGGAGGAEMDGAGDPGSGWFARTRALLRRSFVMDG